MKPCRCLTAALALALAGCSPKPDLGIPRDAPLSAYVTRPPDPTYQPLPPPPQPAVAPEPQQTPAELERIDQISRQKRAQEDADARAMVLESWPMYRREIEEIAVGFKCDVVDGLSADVAIRAIEVEMSQSLIDGHVMDTRGLDIKRFADDAVQSGRDAAAQGACNRLTPADRGRLRSYVTMLMQTASSLSDSSKNPDFLEYCVDPPLEAHRLITLPNAFLLGSCVKGLSPTGC